MPYLTDHQSKCLNHLNYLKQIERIESKHGDVSLLQVECIDFEQVPLYEAIVILSLLPCLSEGLCSKLEQSARNVLSDQGIQIFRTWMTQTFKTWVDYSGVSEYPVPAPDTNWPEDYYNHGDWSNIEYQNSRMRLAYHLFNNTDRLEQLLFLGTM